MCINIKHKGKLMEVSFSQNTALESNNFDLNTKKNTLSKKEQPKTVVKI